jgi:hypothetical protein
MKYTVAISKNGEIYKICKIFFGNDGSYYVSVPYHSAKKSFIFKSTYHINSESKPETIMLSKVIDSCSSDNKRVKLSHHPDGFVQFSGDGLISGKNEKGDSKGVGLYSWPLTKPPIGPAFSISFWGVRDFQIVENDHMNRKQEKTLIFEDSLLMRKGNGYILEGIYFPESAKDQIMTHNNKPFIPLAHPILGNVPIPTILETSIAITGIMGIIIYKENLSFKNISSGFVISGSPEVKTDEGVQKMTLIGCQYPELEQSNPKRSLNYK